MILALEQAPLPVLLPLHPRSRKIIPDIFRSLKNIRIIEPVGYLEMLSLTMGSYKVITDSGGLQKEAYFLNKPCITVRNETEWVETLHDNWNTLTGTRTEKILEPILAPLPGQPQRHDFGNGQAAEIIIKKLSGMV